MWIYESYIIELRLKNEYGNDLHSNKHDLSSSEKEAWKNSGLYGIRTHDLCDTGVVLYQLSEHANFSGILFTTAWVVFVTAKIVLILKLIFLEQSKQVEKV